MPLKLLLQYIVPNAQFSKSGKKMLVQLPPSIYMLSRFRFIVPFSGNTHFQFKLSSFSFINMPSSMIDAVLFS